MSIDVSVKIANETIPVSELLEAVRVVFARTFTPDESQEITVTEEARIPNHDGIALRVSFRDAWVRVLTCSIGTVEELGPEYGGWHALISPIRTPEACCLMIVIAVAIANLSKGPIEAELFKLGEHATAAQLLALIASDAPVSFATGAERIGSRIWQRRQT